ncbi:hypothetical protein SAMN05216389_10621 [Oceanobacillus limi]|uniref:Uncharacterized protein n=1 Tax=Oceanobacillus limi TaxID=930131 RepID=A0A1I0C646_9BACI|nr:hypothetical protein [Oceanobacillus limi]SET14215.1 hypothetical protein SAMN05216389_10621 [Oceanobacillus limi]
MAEKERLNEEAALNNNLGSSTLKRNHDIAEQHQKPKLTQQQKKNSNG